MKMMSSSMEMRTLSCRKKKKSDRGSWKPYVKSIIPRLSLSLTILMIISSSKTTTLSLRINKPKK